MRNIGIFIFNWVNRHPVRSFFLYFLIVAILPLLFTINTHIDRLNFKDTGQIGDTIGGITAPFIGLLSAYLVYISFRQQYLANKLLIDARKEDAIIQNINVLINRLEKTISEYRHEKKIRKHSSTMVNIETVEIYGKAGIDNTLKEIFTSYENTFYLLAIEKNKDDLKKNLIENNEILISEISIILDYFLFAKRYIQMQKIESSIITFNLDYISQLYNKTVNDKIENLLDIYSKIKSSTSWSINNIEKLEEMHKNII